MMAPGVPVLVRDVWGVVSKTPEGGVRLSGCHARGYPGQSRLSPPRPPKTSTKSSAALLYSLEKCQAASSRISCTVEAFRCFPKAIALIVANLPQYNCLMSRASQVIEALKRRHAFRLAVMYRTSRGI